MHPTTRWAGLALPLAALLTATPAHAQELTLIPGFELNDLTEDDGLVAVGETINGSATWGPGGLQALPGVFELRHASAQGKVLQGWDLVGGAIHATRWTLATGWTALPQPADSAGNYLNPKGLSADGAAACGLALPDPAQSAAQYVAWRWSQADGTVLLGDLAVEGESRAHCVAGDGSLVGGERAASPTQNRRAVVWDAGGEPFELVPSTWPNWQANTSRVQALNADGSAAAGQYGNDAFLWTQTGGAQLLPEFADTSGLPLFVVGLSDDAQSVAGYDASGQSAWLWTAGQGLRRLSDIAAQLELDPGPSTAPLQDATALSADGLRLAGQQPDATGTGVVGWILELPTQGVGLIVDRGGALPGLIEPTLDAFGSFGANTPARFDVGGLPPGGKATLVIGFSELSTPFKGGTLVPFPDLLLPVQAPSGGTTSVPFSWPAGVPASTSLFAQAWAKSDGTPGGFASSRALELITP